MFNYCISFIVYFSHGKKLSILFNFVLKLLNPVYWLRSLLLVIYICLQVFVSKDTFIFVKG